MADGATPASVPAPYAVSQAERDAVMRGAPKRLAKDTKPRKRSRAAPPSP